MRELLKNSPAYQVLLADKRAGRLSHAYMFVCQDGETVGEYLKIFAKLISCGEDDFCDNCRICRLIEDNASADVSFYPKEGKLKTDAADEVVRQSVIKPFELDKRIFVLKNIEELAQYQNKLLKTLEEPPKNVHLLLSSKRPSAVLSTIKSRVKTVEIPLFSEELLLEAGKRRGFYGERLELSVALSGGKMGDLVRYYETSDLLDLKDLAVDVIVDMTTKTLPTFAAKLKNASMSDFISIIKLLLNKLLLYKIDGKDLGYGKLYLAAEKCRYGAIIAIIERLSGLEKSLNFNANSAMAIDRVLFALMEEKTKWQKL